jgi:hypothetical protein
MIIASFEGAVLQQGKARNWVGRAGCEAQP